MSRLVHSGTGGTALSKGINRRSFLKLSGSVAAAAAIPQVLTACSPSDKDDSKKSENAVGTAQPEYDKIGRCTCAPNCVGSCGINAFVKDDTIIKVEPADFPMCPLSRGKGRPSKGFAV